MPRLRTAKAVAKRIDLDYHNHLYWLRKARWALIALFVGGGVAWLAAGFTRGDHTPLNPGPLTASHAMWENNCTICHSADGKGAKSSPGRLIGGFTLRVSDPACLQCHDASIHPHNQGRKVPSSPRLPPPRLRPAREERPARRAQHPNRQKTNTPLGLPSARPTAPPATRNTAAMQR